MTETSDRLEASRRTQNIYDDETFFEAYSRLDRSIHGLDGAPEWRALRALLPDVTGRRVLDLGCGYGWFCRWARQQGAATVRGIDVSEKMLARAARDWSTDGIDYDRADLEVVRLPPASVDLAYSSLALHYIERLDALVEHLHAAIVSGGRFVFSVEHPLMTARGIGPWITTDEGEDVWPVARYLDEGPRSTDWLVPGVVKQHRTIESYVAMLVGAGFRLSHLEEWAPTPADVEAHPEWARERERPPFLLIAADRP